MATFLASRPANPITDLLEGAVWAVRRTLFPASVGVVTRPIRVPLSVVDVCSGGKDPAGNCSGDTLARVGIWLTLGSGNPIPQFFEFDTGSGGFVAAYASDNPTASPWWGSSVVVTGGSVNKSFDSGTAYDGVVVTTTVSFYQSATSTTALLTTGGVKVGQIDTITVDKDGTTTTPWTPTGSPDGQPPIEGTFYGDFGAASTYAENGINNVLNELTFGPGMRAGYRIHLDGDDPSDQYVEIGLRNKDVDDPNGLYFAMVPDPLAPGNATNQNSGTRFFAQQLLLATINITSAGNSLIEDAGVGITLDTGADTTLHNTDRSSQQSAVNYYNNTDFKDADDTKGHLVKDLDFSLSGTTTSGATVNYFQFTTGSSRDELAEGINRVDIQNSTSAKSVYYLNTGIQLFLENEVVYDMRNGKLGLIP